MPMVHPNSRSRLHRGQMRSRSSFIWAVVPRLSSQASCGGQDAEATRNMVICRAGAHRLRPGSGAAGGDAATGAGAGVVRGVGLSGVAGRTRRVPWPSAISKVVYCTRAAGAFTDSCSAQAGCWTACPPQMVHAGRGLSAFWAAKASNCMPPSWESGAACAVVSI